MRDNGSDDIGTLTALTPHYNLSGVQFFVVLAGVSVSLDR